MGAKGSVPVQFVYDTNIILKETFSPNVNNISYRLTDNFGKKSAVLLSPILTILRPELEYLKGNISTANSYSNILICARNRDTNTVMIAVYCVISNCINMGRIHV